MSRKSEVRRQESEVRSPKSEVNVLTSDFRLPISAPPPSLHLEDLVDRDLHGGGGAVEFGGETDHAQHVVVLGVVLLAQLERHGVLVILRNVDAILEPVPDGDVTNHR